MLHSIAVPVEGFMLRRFRVPFFPFLYCPIPPRSLYHFEGLGGDSVFFFVLFVVHTSLHRRSQGARCVVNGAAGFFEQEFGRR